MMLNRHVFSNFNYERGYLLFIGQILRFWFEFS
jgi:hypothetical protein